MRLLVCGGRDFSDRASFAMAMAAVDALRGPITCIIHGDYRGADAMAKSWAREPQKWGRTGWPIEDAPFPANWDTHGHSAGPIRNAQMLREGKPDRVIAFPGGDGTADMIAKARAARVPVWSVPLVYRSLSHSVDAFPKSD